MISTREGFGDVLAEGVKRAAERLGEPRQGVRDLHRAGCGTARPRSPRSLGGDARHLHVRHGDYGDREPGASHRAGAACPHQSVRRRAGGEVRGGPARAAQFRGLARRLHLHHPDAAGERLPGPQRRHRLERISIDEAMRFGRRTAAINRAVLAPLRITRAPWSIPRHATGQPRSTALPRARPFAISGRRCSTPGTQRSATTARPASLCQQTLRDLGLDDLADCALEQEELA